MAGLEGTEDSYCFPSATLMANEESSDSFEDSTNLMNALYKLISPLGVVLIQTNIDKIVRISNIQFSTALTTKEASALEQMVTNGSDGKVRIVFKKSKRFNPHAKQTK